MHSKLQHFWPRRAAHCGGLQERGLEGATSRAAAARSSRFSSAELTPGMSASPSSSADACAARAAVWLFMTARRGLAYRTHRYSGPPGRQHVANA